MRRVLRGGTKQWALRLSVTALDAWMLVPGWIRGHTAPESATLKLDHVVDHIDHVCQLAGNALDAGIGSDLDGAFSREQTPQDLETIADLAKIPALLAQRGYPPPPSPPSPTRISSASSNAPGPCISHLWLECRPLTPLL